MVYSPLRSFGRFVLAACAVSLGVASLGAQTPSTAAPAGPNPSRFDLFTGYSYFGAHGQLKPLGVNYSSIDLGAIGSGAYYFNKYFGGEVNFVAHPDGKNDGLYSASAGPIFRAPMQNFTLFAHGLAGGAKLVGPNSYRSFQYHNPWTWGPTLTAGGGMDYDLPFWNNRFSFRLFEADYRYVHANFGPYNPPPSGPTGGRANLSGVDLSTGIVTHFGHIIPPPPVTFSCSASPATAYPGDPITVTGTAANLNPKKTATYNWTTDGGTVSGTENTANVTTTNLAPGSYNVKGHVSEGNKPGEMADCSAPFTIQQFQPPTVTCSANPSTVAPGDSSTITAQGVSPQNRPLTYSYSSTAGSVTGNTSTATLNTTGAAPGTITVTANVVDDKGQSASCTATVTVNAPPAPPAPTTSALCSINFERDKRRPTRVDNEAKACLDEVALNLQRSSDAKLAVVGHSASNEKGADKAAASRAVNTKDYLVKEKGIDSSRISVYTGPQDGKTVTSTLIPTGATLDETGLTPVSESVKAVPRTRRAAVHHKKK
ncbi:OmpA family protein [Edaphobacter albus]|uniref:OmpA family protein n=1 Tax=Edaphobacter sp. 4G125 TaxID=2763071 RepID=UPI001648C6A0|nr:OmpA family protein [Edaphobacter sp. 4G125]QNI35974.1 OmpA family protein [Edaphobacter sp. 4G125]